MKKFNACDIYHICCRAGGALFPDILDYVVINMGATRSRESMNMIASILKYLRELDFIKVRYLPNNWSRVLTQTEIDQLEKFTGE
jgi:hypothetical protein